MHPRYRRFIQSDFADLKNHSIRSQGIPVYAAEFLREFAGDGPVGAPRHRRSCLPHLVARRLPLAARGNGLRRAAPDRARHAARLDVNFDLSDEHELIRQTVRDFAVERVAPGRRGARPRAPLPVRARRRAGRARADGDSRAGGATAVRAATRCRTRSRSRS